jgi:hypothetical protein
LAGLGLRGFLRDCGKLADGAGGQRGLQETTTGARGEGHDVK